MRSCQVPPFWKISRRLNLPPAESRGCTLCPWCGRVKFIVVAIVELCVIFNMQLFFPLTHTIQDLVLFGRLHRPSLASFLVYLSILMILTLLSDSCGRYVRAIIHIDEWSRNQCTLETKCSIWWLLLFAAVNFKNFKILNLVCDMFLPKYFQYQPNKHV